MDRLGSDLKCVRTAARRLSQLARIYAEDFKHCADLADGDKSPNGGSPASALHEQAAVFAHRVDQWAAVIAEQQDFLAAMLQRLRASGKA